MLFMEVLEYFGQGVMQPTAHCRAHKAVGNKAIDSIFRQHDMSRVQCPTIARPSTFPEQAMLLSKLVYMVSSVVFNEVNMVL